MAAIGTDWLRGGGGKGGGKRGGNEGNPRKPNGSLGAEREG